MALREDRYIVRDDVNFVLNDVAAPGSVLCYSTAGSGSSQGDTAGVVQLASNPSGLKVAGVLLQNFVNIDETLYHINWHKNEQQVASPAWFMKEGWVVMDKVSGSPTIGDKAYLTSSGVVMPTNNGLANTPYVGEFQGKKDADGYVKLYTNLPQSN